MLNYQSTSFHDALYARSVLGLRPAPEFEKWLIEFGIFADGSRMTLTDVIPLGFQNALNQFKLGLSK
jgi:ethanolamine ammonia-lyase large subunit